MGTSDDLHDALLWLQNRRPTGHHWPVPPQTNSRPGSTSALDVAALLTGWTENGSGSLARRLANGLRTNIASGLLEHQAVLPAERSLAEVLAVSRSTVSAALDELRGQGLVESRQGSGTVVCAPDIRSVVGTRMANHYYGRTIAIDLSSGNPPDASHLPKITFDLSDLMATGVGAGVQPLGLDALRTALAERHTAQGRITDIDQIHVTAGAHQAVSLIIGALVGRGDTIAVEDPSYPGIFDITDSLGARVVPLASDRAGVLPEALDATLATERPALVYLQSGPHNPTGRLPSPARTRAMAEVLDRHGATVVEDLALAELSFPGRVRPELADLCRRATVVSVESFSKVAWGGLRIGWFRAPAPLVEATGHRRLAYDFGAAAPSQFIALRLLPHLEELAARRRVVLSTSIERTVERLRDDLPEWEIDPPGGGSVLWVRLPVEDSGALVAKAARHGVRVAPGSSARAGRVADPHVRICVDRPWPVVEEGIRRLCVAWREAGAAPEPVLG
jgi:DNA-binding transcriptional MocR family regulator